LDPDALWVTYGQLQLKPLKKLEMEIEDDDVGHAAKDAFAEGMESVMWCGVERER
jgi:hypothetical protein